MIDHCISLVDRRRDVALQHSRSRRTFQEEQARILAATNSTITVECNEAVFESTLTPAGSTCASLGSHLANVVALTVGSSSDQSSFVSLYTTRRRNDGCTTERRKNTENTWASTEEPSGTGARDMISEQDSNPQDSSFLVPAQGTGSANGVKERLTYTSTTANDNAGRPPSYRH